MSGMYEYNAVCHMLRYHPSGTRGGRRISSSRSNPSPTTPHLAVPTSHLRSTPTSRRTPAHRTIAARVLLKRAPPSRGVRGVRRRAFPRRRSLRLCAPLHRRVNSAAGSLSSRVRTSRTLRCRRACVGEARELSSRQAPPPRRGTRAVPPLRAPRASTPPWSEQPWNGGRRARRAFLSVVRPRPLSPLGSRSACVATAARGSCDCTRVRRSRALELLKGQMWIALAIAMRMCDLNLLRAYAPPTYR